MADQRCAKATLRVAWELTFFFNGSSGRAWPTKSLIAKKIRMSVSSVASGLAELESCGHVIRTYEEYEGKPRRIIRPNFNQAVQYQPTRTRKGGVPVGVDPRFRSLERVGSDPFRDE